MHPLVLEISQRLTVLAQTGKEITLCWIPSHVGINGNELAGAAAKRAAQRACTRRLPLPARDFYPAISSVLLDCPQLEERRRHLCASASDLSLGCLLGDNSDFIDGGRLYSFIAAAGLSVICTPR